MLSLCLIKENKYDCIINVNDVIMKYAPVVIPTLNRFEHFRKSFESLEKCSGAKYTDVYIGLDYPPSEKYIDGWKKIDNYLKEKELSNKFRTLTIIRRKTNYFFSGKGNASSIIQDLLEIYDRYIFAEDDIVFSPNFLEYMNQCFEKYGDDDSVIGITGYSYPINWNVPNNVNCFRQKYVATVWGWGVMKKWRDRLVDDITTGYLYKNADKALKNKVYKRMTINCLSTFVGCLYNKDNLGHNKLTLRPTDVAIRLYMAMNGKCIIQPVLSKTMNLGFDGSGIWCQNIGTIGNKSYNYNYKRQIIDSESTFLCSNSDDIDDESIFRQIFDFDVPNNYKKIKIVLMIKLYIYKIFGYSVIKTIKLIKSCFCK